MHEWIYRIERLPRNPYPTGSYTYDLLRCSINGRYAALAYSVNEARMLTYVGLLALFGGDPAAPQLLFSNAEFRCMGFDHSLQWLNDGMNGENVLCVQAPMLDPVSLLTEIPFCFFDVPRRLFTFYPMRNSCGLFIECNENGWVIREQAKLAPAMSLDPSNLQWCPWSEFNTHEQYYFSGLFGRAT